MYLLSMGSDFGVHMCTHKLRKGGYGVYMYISVLV